MTASFPTFRRLAAFLGRTCHLWLLFVAALFSGAGLVAMAWFLSRFAGSWPEMFRDQSYVAMFQAMILFPAATAFASMGLAQARRPRAAGNLLIVVFVVITAAANLVVMTIAADLRPRQWDVGMGVDYDWSPHGFLLQLFMTRLASYVTVSVLSVVTLAVILRTIYVRRVD